MVYRPRRRMNIYTSPENKIKAVERILDEHMPTKQIAEEMNVSQTSIQQWVKQYKDFGPVSFLNMDTQKRPMSLVDAEELARLKAIEIAYEEQQIQVEILLKLPNLFQTEVKPVYFEAITSLRKEYTVRQLAKAFNVSPSGYYDYLKRPQNGPSERDWRDKEMIQCLYDEVGGIELVQYRCASFCIHSCCFKLDHSGSFQLSVSSPCIALESSF